MTSNTLRVNRTTLARRYLPLAAVIAVQLLIIAVAPSKVARDGQQVSAGGFGGDTGFAGETAGDAVGGEGGAAGLSTTGGEGGASGTGGGGGGAARSGAAGGAAGAAGAAAGVTGDVSHCVGDRQFDPGIWPWAPACSGKFKGDNGGATAIGVTKDTIKVVVMRGNYGTTVDAILTASGSNPSAPDFDAALRTAEKFINERFELYGRKIQFKQRKFRNGTGGEGPPNFGALRNEVREIVQEEKPFGVIFSNPQAGPIFNEFSKLGVVNLGGYGNTDAFFKSNAPYHWDVNLSGSEMATHTANWWCTRMNGQKASYVGNNVPDMRNTTRVLGIVGTDEQENQQAVGEFEAAIGRQCGAKVAHKYFYSPNVQTAPAQRRAAIEKMREAPQSTTVMCWCDQVAPAFLYDEEELNNYYPENIMIGAPYMDDDDVAQTYDHFFDPQRPANEYPTYENGFGFAQYPEDEPVDRDRAARVWKAGGGAGAKPNFDAAGDYDYWMMIATLIQYSGPRLTAENIAAGAARSQPTAPGGGADPRLPPRAFSPGDYTWNDAVREVYWSPRKKSPGEGADGAYSSLNGGRWFTGAFPAGPLALPPKPR